MNVQTQVLEKSVNSMHQDVPSPKGDNSELEEQIKKKIISRLGKPKGFFRVDANHLWDNYWRVNVWCKFYNSTDKVVPGFKISDSFFVTVGKNNRLSANPKIVKKY